MADRLLPYPDERGEIARTLRQPGGHIWLRIVARLMEWLSDLQPKQLNYSDVTPWLAVGGSFRPSQVRHLKARGVTAVVDCREEAEDDPVLLRRSGIDFLHLPAPDRFAMSFDQLQEGVNWINEHVASGGKAFLHCEHGVGRGPLMACALLVSRGHDAGEALRTVRSGRWQAMPNDRQLQALLDFEREWNERPLRVAEVGSKYPA